SKRDWSSDVCSSDLNTLWISPASDFALVRQTLRVSVSTPVRVPMKVLPCAVKTLTCFWRRFESSSMNFRPAVEDSYPQPSKRVRSEERRVGKECRGW